MFWHCWQGYFPTESVILLVVDAEDTFWQVPLHREERRFYCAMLHMPGGRIRYLAYNRTAQGYRGAPPSWAVLFGLISRCALSTRMVPDVHGRFSGTASPQRLQVYVDDPIWAVRGTKTFIDRQFCITMLAWAALPA